MGEGDLIEKINKKGVRYYEYPSGNVVSKVCTKCSTNKLLSEFYPKKNSFKGRNSVCSECSKKAKTEYIERNKEAVNQSRKEYKEKTKTKSEKYRADNIERHRAYGRVYYQKHKDRVRKKVRDYTRKNPHIIKSSRLRSKANRLGLPANFSGDDYLYKIKLFDGCALSNREEIVHMDHVIPLYLGIEGSTKDNILPMAATLNLSKGRANIFEWYKKHKDRLNLDDGKFSHAIHHLAELKGMDVEEYRKYVYECFARFEVSGKRPMTEVLDNVE